MRPSPTVSTFSIVARDPESGDLAIATASKFLAVGAVVPYAVADVGAIATQSDANTTFGPRTVDALVAGIPLDLVDAALRATDDDIAFRQYGLVDAGGASVTFTGERCNAWAGGISKPDLAVQGNLLTGPEVVDALVAAYEGAAGAFPERLLAGLAAADAAGGDRRGRQSAALLVVRDGGGYGGHDDRYIDLRVDDDPDPVGRLMALLALQRLYFEPSDEGALLDVEGDVEARLLRVLRSAGHEPGDAWGERAEAALRTLAGIENLEERLVEPGRVDPEVLRHLEARHPG